MKIEDEEDVRKVNRVLWGLSGLSYEEERLRDALSDFELALEVLNAEPRYAYWRIGTHSIRLRRPMRKYVAYWHMGSTERKFP